MHDPLYIGSFGLFVMINKNEYLSCCTFWPFSSGCCVLEYSDCKWMFLWFIADWLYPVLSCFLNLCNITILTSGPKLYRYHTEVRFHWNKTWPRIVFIMLYATVIGSSKAKSAAILKNKKIICSPWWHSHFYGIN